MCGIVHLNETMKVAINGHSCQRSEHFYHRIHNINNNNKTVTRKPFFWKTKTVLSHHMKISIFVIQTDSIISQYNRNLSVPSGTATNLFLTTDGNWQLFFALSL